MKIKIAIISSVVCLVLLSCKSKKETTSTAANSEVEKIKVSNPTVEAVEGINLGNKAPEIMMASPKGNVITLSSFKGKLVLIDFWASWCGPCRAENPTVVTAYNTYHLSEFKNGKGFEVLSVSLDQNEIAWAKAIEKDNLIWPHHVSDLQGWNNAAAKRYGINSIPSNVLIDGNGVIIAKNLRGDILINTLKLFLK
jgi:thiol-disulfide isomerase/thioredoxin